MLPRPASHPNLIQRIKLTPENRKPFGIREKCGLATLEDYMLHSKPVAEGSQGNVEPTLDLAGLQTDP